MLNAISRGFLLAALVAAATTNPVAADKFELTIQHGRVTLVAQDVPVQEILAEWARIGQTTIVNAEKLMGTPVTLQLIDVPEEQALKTLLRSASGYVAAPRATPVSGASRFDRILILVSSRRPAARVVSSPSSGVPQPAFQIREPTQDAQFEDQEFGASAPGQPAPTMFEYASPSQLQQLQELLRQPGGELQGPVISPTSPFDQPQTPTSPNFGTQGASRPGVAVNPPSNTRTPGQITSPCPGTPPSAPVAPQEPDPCQSAAAAAR